MAKKKTVLTVGPSPDNDYSSIDLLLAALPADPNMCVDIDCSRGVVTITKDEKKRKGQ